MKFYPVKKKIFAGKGNMCFIFLAKGQGVFFFIIILNANIIRKKNI